MKNITVNNEFKGVPEDVATLADLVKYLNIEASKTALAANGRFVAKEKWMVTHLNDGDVINVITAAYGG